MADFLPTSGIRLKSLISQYIRDSSQYLDNSVDKERRNVWDYYYSRPYGDEMEGRSSVVTSDVQDHVEQAMPTLTEIFLDNEDYWKFDPTDEMTDDAAEDATEAVNDVIYRQNRGWKVVHDALKASLMFKNGYIKVGWEEGENGKEVDLQWQTGEQVVRLNADPDVEIVDIEYAEEGFEDVDPRETFLMDAHYDLRIKRDMPGKVKLWGCPYEEILHPQNLVDFQDADCVIHRYLEDRSTLIEEGHDPETIYRLPAYTELDYQSDRVKRFQPEKQRGQIQTSDKATQKVQIYECYLRADFDGDGVAEYGLVLAAGNGSAQEILPDPDTGDEWVPVLEHPFVDVASIALPYKHLGRCMSDLLIQTQRKKSSIQRIIQDNAYQINNGRDVINERVSQADYLNNVPGMPIRCRGDEPIQGAVVPLGNQVITPQMLALLESYDQEAEKRTGVTFSTQPYDAEAMKATFGGLNLMLGESQKRLLYTARIQAEGLANLPLKVLRLLIQYQRGPMAIKSGNAFKTVDPRPWSPDMGIQLNLNFAMGTAQQKSAMYDGVLREQEMIIERHQNGRMEGPIVTMDQYLNILHKSTKAKGLKASNLAFNEFDEAVQQYQVLKKEAEAKEAQQTQFDPLAEHAKLEQFKAQTNAQAKRLGLELDHRIKQEGLRLDDQRKREEMALDDNREREEIALEDDRDRDEMVLDARNDRMRNLLQFSSRERAS